MMLRCRCLHNRAAAVAAPVARSAAPCLRPRAGRRSSVLAAAAGAGGGAGQDNEPGAIGRRRRACAACTAAACSRVRAHGSCACPPPLECGSLTLTAPAPRAPGPAPQQRQVREFSAYTSVDEWKKLDSKVPMAGGESEGRPGPVPRCAAALAPGMAGARSHSSKREALRSRGRSPSRLQRAAAPAAIERACCAAGGTAADQGRAGETGHHP
jgi:hypothetical protein